MNNELQQYLNDILNQKVTYLTPENIKEGVTILGVDGNGGTVKLVENLEILNSTQFVDGDTVIVYNDIDKLIGYYSVSIEDDIQNFTELDKGLIYGTKDANISEGDIVNNKIAYSNGEKIIGKINVVDTNNIWIDSSSDGKSVADDKNNANLKIIETFSNDMSTEIDYGKVFRPNSSVQFNIPYNVVSNALNLTSDMIVEGKNILGVAGNVIPSIDMSDANVTNMDISYGKIAYANGKRIVGSLNEIDSSNSMDFTARDLYRSGDNLLTNVVQPFDAIYRNNSHIYMNIPIANIIDVGNITANKIVNGANIFGVNGTVEGLKGQTKTVTPKTEIQVITPTGNYNGLTSVTIEAVTNNISPNIQPDNIKAGIEILGTIGNLELIDTNGFFEVPETGIQVNILESIKQIPSLDVSTKISMANAFLNCIGLEGVPQLDTSNITDMYATFRNCRNLVTIPNMNTSKVTNMSYMFQNCINLNTIPHFDTSNVTNMSYMFHYTNNLYSIPNLDTSNVISMNSTFEYTDLYNLPNLNTAKVTNMNRAFAGTHISVSDLSNLDTSNVRYANAMFLGSSLNNIPNIDMTNMVTLYNMFNLCIYIETVRNLNICNVTGCSNMFTSCYNLKEVSFENTSEMALAASMFSGCNNLINVSNLDLRNTVNVENMFRHCSNLISIQITNSNTPRLNNIENMFDECKSLVDVPQFNFTNVKYGKWAYAFSGCNNLSNESLSNIITSISTINANSAGYVGDRTLESLGLENIQINYCINLPQWQDCVNNGWSAIY